MHCLDETGESAGTTRPGPQPGPGRVEWIGVRPGRRRPVLACGAVQARAGRGLAGDRYGRLGGNRQVTLIETEGLAAAGALLGTGAVDPALVRRNLAVSGIDLAALVGRRFAVGEAVLEGTGPCRPCAHMDEALGPGGRDALAGRGGLTARVIQGGHIRLGDPVRALAPDAPPA